MKIIILAAGEGKRLRPFTNDRPKCMVELHGKPILHYQLDVMRSIGIPKNNIAIVGGYLQNAISAKNIKQYNNPDYYKTNMVETLFKSENFMSVNNDLIIVYGDIIYDSLIFSSILNAKGDVVVAADLNWKKLWELRMDDPLEDAESFKIGDDGYLSEIGKKTNSYDDIDAQYMGLIKIKKWKVGAFIDFYHNLDRTKYYDGCNYKNMYMTSFLQEMINKGWNITPKLMQHPWLEVDTAEELILYEKLGIFKN